MCCHLRVCLEEEMFTPFPSKTMESSGIPRDMVVRKNIFCSCRTPSYMDCKFTITCNNNSCKIKRYHRACLFKNVEESLLISNWTCFMCQNLSKNGEADPIFIDGAPQRISHSEVRFSTTFSSINGSFVTAALTKVANIPILSSTDDR